MELVDLIIWIFIIMMQLIFIFFFVFILRKRQLWSLIMLGLTGHGSLAIKFLQDNGVEFVFSKKPIQKIFWKYKDKDGKVKKYSQEVAEVKHRLSGTSIPIHLCPHNTTTNVSMLEEKTKEATAKEFNELLNYQYMQGVIDTRKMMQKPMGFGLDYKIILVIGMIALIALLAYPQIANSFAPK